MLLGHMGGPLWENRDEGAWSVPKGEYGPEETAWKAARREFREELGLDPPEGRFESLGSARQSGGKLVTVWAVPGQLDPGSVVPGTFEMEWPRGSGRIREFPEIDRVAWFGLEEAARRILPAQRVFLDRLGDLLEADPGEWE
ncbi:Predicted NTP pyrophosphohydrolase, NUDIX family [Actinopolyspora xinjiangensis]|uniref:Predicted NTP pyrophosphohydrolase, NUDIX family n=1 Tax=Actinopolyspora xinjiangensis TaxID=405564 RepID=A0A1H0NXB7_9ACTN|nr:Predicted NTP pyrophosphohydrolase, NUDIX family [Actinopolyspora xinjiangensis]